MSEFRELYCGLTNDHIVKEPISLSCGHCICKRPCLTYQKRFRCKICSVETDESELNADMESDPIKQMIKSDLSGLFQELEKRVTHEINTFKSLLETREATIDAHLKYIEEEIEIRIESIKINLEKLFETFKKDLIEIKKEMMEIQNDALNRKTDTLEFEDNLKELRDYIKNNQTKTEEKFYEQQENFKNINIMIQNFQDAFYNCKLDLKLSQDQVEKKLIGEIIFEGLKAYKMNKLKRVLLNGKFRAIRIPVNGVSINALPNGNLVYSTNNQVILLNENFQEVKNVSLGEGGDSFCASYHRNEIYVSDYSKHCIILFDLNLNELKKFGTKGVGNNQLKGPCGLCCHGDYLYICDSYNERIQILTLDFEYVSTIQTDNHSPCRVQTSETTIGVSCHEATLFYDLNTRALKYKHNILRTYNINYIDSIFCAINVWENKFYFFDSDGNFVEEKSFYEERMLSNSMNTGSMCIYKDILYMTEPSGWLYQFPE